MERLRPTLAWMSLLGLLAGCGGSTDHNPANDGAPHQPSGGTNAMPGAAGGAATDGVGGAAPVMTLDAFETAEVYVSIGLWMGFPGDKLPIGTPATPHDGSALHLVGTTDDAGLDVFFHTGTPVERIWSGVRFWTQSDAPGALLTVAVAGPEPSYFTDRARGLAWPERVIKVGSDWREVVVDFKDLGVDADHLSPHSEIFGAFHFIIEPNTKYDLWIDDFAGQPF